MATLGQYFRGLRRLAFASLRKDTEAAARERRLMAFRLLQGEASQVTFTRSGITWTVDLDGGAVPKKLFVRSNAFEPLRKGLVGWLKGNGYLGVTRGTIVDIGANIGTPSVQLARETGLNVLAIEPVPANFALLTRNVAQKGFEQHVTGARAAVSLHPGTLKMAVPKDRATCEVIDGANSPGFGKLTPDIPIIEVPSSPLSALLTEHGIASEQVGLVWCDAQGMEREIVESAPELWKAGVPLYLELWPAGMNAHGGTDAFLTTVERHFKGFVPISAMTEHGAKAAPQPIAALRAFVAKISSFRRRAAGLSRVVGCQGSSTLLLAAVRFYQESGRDVCSRFRASNSKEQVLLLGTRHPGRPNLPH